MGRVVHRGGCARAHPERVSDNNNTMVVADSLTAAEARRAAGQLASQNEALKMQLHRGAQEIAEAKAWVEKNAPRHIGRGARVLGSAVAGIATGMAFGTARPAYALAGSAVAATAAGLGVLAVDSPDFKDFLTCVSGGIAATALGIESAKATQEFWAERAAKKAQQPPTK